MQIVVPLLQGDVLEFIVEMVERIDKEEPSAAEQILADLETLEMIVIAGPENRQYLLEDMWSRYKGADFDTIEWQMREFTGKWKNEI